MSTPSNSTDDSIYEQMRGSVLFDGIFQAFLLGLVIGQALKYWKDYRDDSWRKQLFVGIVVILSILQTMIEEFKVWKVTIDFQSWSKSAFAWTDILVNGCICWMCEVFFIRRCWKMTEKSRWVLFPLGFVSSTILLANIYLTINLALIVAQYDHQRHILKGASFLLPSIQIAFTYWISASFFLDVVVAGILIFHLWHSKTGQTFSDKVVNSVIWTTCSSTALPCTSMVAAISVYHCKQQGNVVLLFVLLTGKLYTLGLLRTLNARGYLRLRMKSHDLGRVTLSAWQWDQAQTQATAINPNLTSGIISPKLSNDKTLSFRNPFSPLTNGTTSHRGSNLTRLNEEIAPRQMPVQVCHASGTAPLSPEVTFSSPRIDSSERGYSIHRVSSNTVCRIGC